MEGVAVRHDVQRTLAGIYLEVYIGFLGFERDRTGRLVQLARYVEGLHVESLQVGFQLR